MPLPVQGGTITQVFGPTNEPLDAGGVNKGVDIGVPIGTPVSSVVGGVVISAGDSNDGWGISVKIRDAQGNVHNYGHLDSANVTVGQQVPAGFNIGASGNTGKSDGPHLSYDVWDTNGTYLDPALFIGGPSLQGDNRSGHPAIGQDIYQYTGGGTPIGEQPAAQAPGPPPGLMDIPDFIKDVMAEFPGLQTPELQMPGMGAFDMPPEMAEFYNRLGISPADLLTAFPSSGPPAPSGGATGMSGPVDENGITIDDFMRAIGGAESGGDYNATNPDSGAHGKYQIMPSNWPAWAAEAGLGAGAPQTPENQEYVARFKITQYYNQYGNWADVAAAWYSGGPLDPATADNPQNGYPSIRSYVNTILSSASNIASQRGASPQTGAQTQMANESIFNTSGGAFGPPAPGQSWEDYNTNVAGGDPSGQSPPPPPGSGGGGTVADIIAAINASNGPTPGMPGTPYTSSSTSFSTSAYQPNAHDWVSLAWQQYMDMLGYNLDRDQFGLDRDRFGFDVRQFDETMAFSQAQFEWQKAQDQLNYALAVGNFDLARQAQASADYWSGQANAIERSRINLQNQGQQLDYLLGNQGQQLDYYTAMAQLAQGGDVNRISQAGLIEQGNQALLADATARGQSVLSGQLDQYANETQRAQAQAQAALANNQFMLEASTSPRDLFGLFMMQRGVAPDWDTLAAGGTPAMGQALAPSNPMAAFQGLNTMPDFSPLQQANPYAGQMGDAARAIQLTGTDQALNIMQQGMNTFLPMNQGFIPYLDASAPPGPSQVTPTALNQYPSFNPDAQTAPQWIDINPGGTHQGVPIANVQGGWNLATVGGEGTYRRNFHPDLFVGAGRDFGMGFNDPDMFLEPGTKVWLYANPDTWGTPQAPGGGVDLPITNPQSPGTYTPPSNSGPYVPPNTTTPPDARGNQVPPPGQRPGYDYGTTVPGVGY